MTLTLADSILIECLAGVTALFEPLRDWEAPYWAATCVLRWRYDRLGLPWRAAGDKERERALSNLVHRGLVARRRAASKTIGVRLTQTGLEHGWRLTGTPADNARVITEKVAELGPGGRWVPEIAFVGASNWGDDLKEELKSLQTFHAPALVRQWIESNADFHGRLAYRCTKAGLAALRKPETAPSTNGDGEAGSPEPEDEVMDVYLQAYSETINWLNTLDNDRVDARGEIGQIPLNVAEWSSWVLT
jgi:hypothetical protein